MNNEEARARVAAQDARLRDLETEIARLASTNATPVLLAILPLGNSHRTSKQSPSTFQEGVLNNAGPTYR